MLPNIDETYDYFDDGKITLGRKLSVKIVDIIPFDKMFDIEFLSYWKQEVEECDWLYNPITDYFIKGELDLDTKIEEIYFVRTLENQWFSLGWWAGWLDVERRFKDMTLDNYKNF